MIGRRLEISPPTGQPCMEIFMASWEQHSWYKCAEALRAEGLLSARETLSMTDGRLWSTDSSKHLQTSEQVRGTCYFYYYYYYFLNTADLNAETAHSYTR